MAREFYNYETAKTMLRARICNEAKKTDVEVYALADGFGDLIVVPYLQLDNRYGACVTVELVNSWGVSESEVINQALANMENDVEMMTLGEKMAQFGLDIGNEVPIFFVSTVTGYCGASAILTETAQEKLRNVFPNGYIVLPSSIHEVLVVGADDFVGKEMAKMVSEINATTVAPEDRLSDNVYTFV